MGENRRQQIATLQARALRKRRLPALTAAWSRLGTSISPISEPRQEELLSKLTVARPWLLKETPSVPDLLRAFTVESDAIIVADWDVNLQPAALVGTAPLLLAAARLHDLYRDGFLLFDLNLTKALVVSFDEEKGAEYDLLELVDRPRGCAH